MSTMVHSPNADVRPNTNTNYYGTGSHRGSRAGRPRRRSNNNHRHHHHDRHYQQPFWGGDNGYNAPRGAFMSPPPALFVTPPTFGGIASSWSHHMAFQQTRGIGNEGFVNRDRFLMPVRRNSVLDPTAKEFVPQSFQPVVLLDENNSVDGLEDVAQKEDVLFADKTNQKMANEEDVPAPPKTLNKTKTDAPPPGFDASSKNAPPPGFEGSSIKANLITPDKDDDKRPSPVTVLTPPGWNLAPTTTGAAVVTPSPSLEQMKEQEALCTSVAASTLPMDNGPPTPKTSNSSSSPPTKNAWGIVSKPAPLVVGPRSGVVQNVWSLGSASIRAAAASGMSPVEWPSLPGTAIAQPKLEAQDPFVPIEPRAETPSLIEEEDKVEPEEEEETFRGTKPMDLIRHKMGIVYASAPEEW